MSTPARWLSLNLSFTVFSRTSTVSSSVRGAEATVSEAAVVASVNWYQTFGTCTISGSFSFTPYSFMLVSNSNGV
ncbi:hypothetical protein PR001_g15323 [Phytophthora rubi]|uniref:Secreted protein n=1 Tax=Phytophthora rubi TaxID=129364 RepID=A0A6A3KNZ6_9STRA|nr:hypothetical protein PR002_g15779 [Phytophthora rubi]KAE9013772.1 hypothetical protein PR001_g15323 [Phytophthora rubi]